MARDIEWNINLQPMVNKSVVVETHEGFIRDAKLTKVNFRSIVLNSTVVEYPEDIELNDEDRIPFIQIRSLTLKTR